MTNETKKLILTVTRQGSIVLPNGRLAKPGEKFNAAIFVGKEAVLKRMLAEDLVTTQDLGNVDPIDWSRAGSQQLPAIPSEMDEKRSLRSKASPRDKQIQNRIAELRARQEAMQEAEEAGGELTPEQARAMGLIK